MKIYLFLSLLLSAFWLENQVKWQFEVPKSVKVGDEFILKIMGKINSKWYVYNSKLEVDGPLSTSLELTNKEGFETIGPLEGISPKIKYDEVWAGKVAYFEKNANFTQKYKALKKGSLKIQGVLKGQACSNVDNT
ncbi:MAG: protein-disulfide reductase DsbD domain-containing protein, partial [Leadbetterella sp.]